MEKLSFITCTYNPNIALLSKVIKAILNQIDSSHFNWEYIIVDNNSKNPISDITEIKNLISGNDRIKIVWEPKQGLIFARLAGLEKSSGELLIFVDDDCEIESSYLQQAADISNNFPFLGVFGPGNISVNYFGEQNIKLARHYQYLFQERHISTLLYSNFPDWNEASPPGSGFVVKRSVMSEYATQVMQGNFTASGRKGNSLSSADDTQILFTSIKMKLGTGVFPELKLTHHIPGFRTKKEYLLRLQFGLNFSYILAKNEMFPSNNLKPLQNSNFFFFTKTLNYFIRNIKRGYEIAQIEYAAELGRLNANIRIRNQQVPKLMLKYINFFKLQ